MRVMSATSGSPTQIRTSAATAADLAGTPDDQFADGDLACVTALWPNSTFRLRRTAPGAAPAPDNTSIIATFSDNGYWEVFGAGSGVLVFPTIAALEDFNDIALPDGATVYVQSVRSYWHKRAQANPGTADGITNVQSTTHSTTTWYRDEVASPSWLNTATWYINETTGNDENTGASTLSPIKTHEEFMRRIGSNVLTQDLTVNFVGAFTGVFRHVVDPGQQGTFVVHYQAALNTAAPLLAGQFDNFTAIAYAGNGTPTHFTSALTLATWTALIGKMIVVTVAVDPNDVGAYAFITNATGADGNVEVSTSPFTKASPSHIDTSVVNPATGDTFAVVELQGISPSLFLISAPDVAQLTNEGAQATYSVTFQHLDVTTTQTANVIDGTFATFACAMGYLHANETSIVGEFATMIKQSQASWAAAQLIVLACFVNGNNAAGSLIVTGSGARMHVGSDTLVYDTFVDAQGGSLTLENMCAINCVGVITTLTQKATVYTVGILYGSGNTSYFFQLGSLCAVLNQAATLIASTGASKNLLFGDVTEKDWADLPYINNALVTDSQSAWVNLV